MKMLSSPSEKLRDCFINGNVNKAEKLIKTKKEKCLKSFQIFHGTSFPLTEALKSPYHDKTESILKFIEHMNFNHYNEDNSLFEFFFYYWQPCLSPEKVLIDNKILLIATRCYDKNSFFKELLNENNLPHKDISLDKVYFIMNLIVENNINNSRYSLYFLKCLCLLFNYKPQILRAVIHKHSTLVQKCIKSNNISPEARLITNFIKEIS